MKVGDRVRTIQAIKFVDSNDIYIALGVTGTVLDIASEELELYKVKFDNEFQDIVMVFRNELEEHI